MNLHEYQAKEIFKKFGIPVPVFRVASTVEEAVEIAHELHLKQAVLKIQVHAGGRGKAGGVKFAKSASEIPEIAGALLGMKMVNQQTGPEGVIARQILIGAPLDIAKEFYLCAIVDRNQAEPMLIASPEGGMDIEEIAHNTPEKILKIPFGFDGTLKPYQLLRLTKFMGWTGPLAEKGALLAQQVARCFLETDASMLEINPLVETPSGDLYALDAKLSIDDNALFRHPDIAAFYDPTQVSPQEALAKQFDLAYIAMHGEIGCMVNGAGLAMATMDIIKLHGSSPANFLDVGGSATKEKVAEGFRIILSDPNVKAVLVNIFGGIMNCSVHSEEVVASTKELKVTIPIVVRMEGTNVEQGKKIFRESQLKIISADNLEDAAKQAVKAIR